MDKYLFFTLLLINVLSFFLFKIDKKTQLLVKDVYLN